MIYLIEPLPFADFFMNDDLYCKKCPPNAKCEGRRTKPQANRHYWYLEDRKTVISCQPTMACLGNNECSSGRN